MEIKPKVPVMKITIWLKLLVGIFVIISLITYLSIQGINSLNKLGNLSTEIYNESVATNSIQNLKTNFERLLMPPNDYLIHGNEIENHNFEKVLETIKSEIKQYPDVSELYIEILDLNEMNNYLSEIESRALEIFKLTNPVGNIYGANLMEEMDSIAEEVILKIDEKIITSKEHLRNDILIAHTTYIEYSIVIIVVGLVIILALLIGGFFYVKEITKPLNKLKLTTQKISSGEPFTKAEVKTQDEIADLANSFNQMIGVLEKTTVNRKYFNNILNRMEDSLIITDSNNNIKIVNQATSDLLGYSEQEMIGKSINMVIPEKGSKEVCVRCDTFNRFIDQDQVNNVYNTYTTKDSNPIPVSFSRSVMYDKDNEILGMIILAHHITETHNDVQSSEEYDQKDFRNIKTGGEIPLTKRELEIIKLIAEEFSNLEIAEKLFISVRTVETHRRNIMQKLQINSVISLVHYAIQNRII
jgi:PAS domain S-box-containing protein